MSRNQRSGLIVAAVVVAVLAYVIASPGGGDGGSNASNTTSSSQTDTGAAAPATPKATRIQIRANKVVGGPQEIKVKHGDSVEIVVSSDARNVLHLHGYDIEKTAEPGKPVRFKFKANLEGQFDLESHTAEHAGLEPRVATLIIEPK